MTRIAMIGAGSVVFVRNLLTDILSPEPLRDCAIALHDIDAERLDTAQRMAHALAAQLGAAPAVTAHADRLAAVDGEDAYPALRRAAGDPTIFTRDRVRFELLRQLGWFVSESSEHSAEYTPYFLRRGDQIAAYDVPVDECLRRSEANLRLYAEARRVLLAGTPLTLSPSEEYGARVIHAMTTGEPALIYGNVRNTRLIDNLPEDCCVQMPVVVDRNGRRPCHVGNLRRSSPRIARRMCSCRNWWCAPHWTATATASIARPCWTDTQPAC